MSDSFTLLGGKLTLSGPRSPEDALWLAAAITPPPGAHVLDAMCGNGVVGLALLTRCPGLHVTGVEVDQTLATTAQHNADTNHAPYRAMQANLPDFKPTRLFDYALMNPPFHAQARGHTTPNTAKTLAHGLPPNHLTLWLETLHRLTTPTATLALILHTACQPELLAFAKANGYATTLLPLETTPAKPPKRLLAWLKKGDGYVLTEHPPLPIHNPALRKEVLEMAKALPGPSISSREA